MTKISYQDQDRHQDQVVLQDRVIFQEQDVIGHPPKMQSHHGDFNLLVSIQIMLLIFTLQPSSHLRIQIFIYNLQLRSGCEQQHGTRAHEH
jgi:hypothetical protein